MSRTSSSSSKIVLVSQIDLHLLIVSTPELLYKTNEILIRYSTMRFFDLPTELLTFFYVSWLSMKEIALLDKSICEKEKRSEFLSICFLILSSKYITTKTLQA